jgi:kynurenine formamidase
VPTVPPESEVLRWFDALSNWGRWGDDDQLGTMNHITSAKRVAAAGLAREGVTVSCAWNVDTVPRVDHIAGPAQRFMLGTGEAQPPPGVRGGGAMEFVGLVYHGYTVTHIDGLSHVFWDGRMYNGKPANQVTAWGGALDHAITDLAEGVVTRGVLLDVAGDEGGEWLEPGTGVFPEQLEAAEARQGVRVEEGDVVLLRTGYGKLVRRRGHYNVRTDGRAGWHPACLPWLHERGVAAIAGDTACGCMPNPEYPTIHDPVHAIGIVAMGLWLIDNCDLEALADACATRSRWEFLFMLSPLRVVGGTGSPANPLAVF